MIQKWKVKNGILMTNDHFTDETKFVQCICPRSYSAGYSTDQSGNYKAGCQPCDVRCPHIEFTDEVDGTYITFHCSLAYETKGKVLVPTKHKLESVS